MTNRKASAVTAIAREQGNRTAAASPTRAIYSGIERKISASRLKWKKKTKQEKRSAQLENGATQSKKMTHVVVIIKAQHACLLVRLLFLPRVREQVPSTPLPSPLSSHTHATRQAAGASSTFAILFCYLL